MAPPQLSEDEVDDLIYFARAGEEQDLAEALPTLVSKGGSDTTALAILAAATDEGKNTCLHMAAGNGHEGIVRYLLAQIKARPETEKKAFLDAANEYGNTALHWAAMNGHLSVVKQLVDSGAAPALANDKNYVPLDLAGLNDKLAVVDYFLASSGVRESDNASGDSAAGPSAAADGLSSAAADIDLDGEGDDDEEGAEKKKP